MKTVIAEGSEADGKKEYSFIIVLRNEMHKVFMKNIDFNHKFNSSFYFNICVKVYYGISRFFFQTL